MGSVATPTRPPQTRPHPMLMLRHVAEGESWVLELSGEADIATIATVREALARVRSASQEHVVVDLSRLEFCDVACAHLILTARRTFPCHVRGATGSVKRVFDFVQALRVARLTEDLSGARA